MSIFDDPRVTAVNGGWLVDNSGPDRHPGYPQWVYVGVHEFDGWATFSASERRLRVPGRSDDEAWWERNYIDAGYRTAEDTIRRLLRSTTREAQ